MKNATAIYSKFVEFEEKAANIYLRMASQFVENPNLSAFWLEMAMHEKQHAGLLQFCLHERLFAIDLPSSDEIRKIGSLFKRFEERASAKLTIEEAFSLAIEMERSEVNVIYCRLTTTVHNSLYLLRRKITGSIPNHIDELVRAAEKFGVPKDTMKGLDRLKEDCSDKWRP